MSGPQKSSVRRVEEALRGLGLDAEIREFPAGTRTAEDAAAAIGCTVGQIVKSLVFRTAQTQRPVLVIASGANRVDVAQLEPLAGEPIQRADADFVRKATGFAIGGVPPLGHAVAPITFIDRDLLAHGEIWAAAGTPNAVFRLQPGALEPMTGGTVVDLKQA